MALCLNKQGGGVLDTAILHIVTVGTEEGRGLARIKPPAIFRRTDIRKN